MDKSVREEAAPGAEQMAQQWVALQQRLQELVSLQRARLIALQKELAGLQEAASTGEKVPPQQVPALQPQASIPTAAPLKRLKEQPTPPPSDQQDPEDFRHRYELALEDIRRLEAENRELRAQLEKLRSNNTGPQPEDLESWEAFKRRVLESLEAEVSEPANPTAQTSQQNRVQIEELLAKTEALLAAKDRELESLHHLLENQAANLGAVAVGAAAVEQLLDQDEIIRQQRETLKRLEAEWHEKLRQAEVELSLQRAALARKQAELDQKLQEVEQLRTQLAAEQSEPNPKKGAEGWRKLFGLNEGRRK